MTRRRAAAFAFAAVLVGAAVVGPATSAAAVEVDSMTELADELAAGGTVTLGQDLVGAGVSVGTGVTATLDLMGLSLRLAGDDTDPGLGVPSSSTLIIIDSVGGGDLYADSDNGTGIGGSPLDPDSGTIIIRGGSIDASGSLAGIGGYTAGSGTVTIEGGSVQAAGGTGAGIGSGQAGPGSTISITGGEVTASSFFGAGIGGGANGPMGTVSLTGGIISAESVQGSGIGFGLQYLSFPPNISIAGTPTPGSATAAGDNALAIAGTYAPVATAGLGYTTTSRVGSPPVTALATIRFHERVQFSLDGTFPDATAPSDQTVDWGSAATPPADPVRAGYTFDGWHVDTAGGALWDFSDPVTAPLDLVAAWIELPTISGTPPGGTAGVAYTHAMTVAPPGTTVSVFSGSLPPGLAVDAAGLISGTPTTAGTFGATLRATNGGDHADIAVSITIAPGALHDILIDTNGGSPGPHPIQVAAGDVVPAQSATRPGYVLLDWHVTATAGPVWDFSHPVTGDMTLVAAWGQLPVIDGPATASGTDGVVFTAWVPSQLDGAPTVSDNGTLPAGLTVDSATGQITGTPTGPAGLFNVVLTATNANGTDTANIAITITHGVATSFVASASDLTPDQGDTITITVTASDAYGNSWDASAQATITSNVATDIIAGNHVTFPHASPHVLTVSLPQLAAQQLVIQVNGRVLGLTGSDYLQVALPAALIAILSGASLLLLRRRRWA